VESTITDFEKFHPPQKQNPASTFIDFINIFKPPRLFQPPPLHDLVILIIFRPFFTVLALPLDSFLTEMKLIQEIRPFFALEVYIKLVFEKKITLHAKIHPPRLLIFQKKSNLHVY
jgi:hypothetical protein